MRAYKYFSFKLNLYENVIFMIQSLQEKANGSVCMFTIEETEGHYSRSSITILYFLVYVNYHILMHSSTAQPASSHLHTFTDNISKSLCIRGLLEQPYCFIGVIKIEREVPEANTNKWDAR